MVHQFKLAFFLLSCFTLAACGGGGGGGGGTTNTNNPPSFSATSSQTVEAGSTLTFSVTATDADGPAPLSMSIQDSSPSLPSAAAFVDNGGGSGTLTWATEAGDVGSYTVTFAATESGASGKTTTRNVNITVTDPNAGNEAPTIDAIGDQTAQETEALSFPVTADDPDGPAPLTLALSGSSPSLPAGAGFTDNGDGNGVFSWTPAVGEAGSYDVTFTATDGAGLDASRTITIAITAANQAPDLAPIGDQRVNIDELLEFSVTATDADGPAPLVLTLDQSTPALPAGAVFTDNTDGTGTFSWTPVDGEAGSYTVTFSATDADGLADSETITIVVNDLPTFDPLNDQTITAGELLEFTVTASDPDGPAPLVMSLETAAPALPAAANYTDNADGTGSFSWQTELADAGDYVVTFRATESGSDPAFVEQTVTISVNAPPTLNFVADQSVLVGDDLDFQVSAVDPDGPTPIELTQSSQPALPAGASFTDNGNGTADFDWSPTAADNGRYLVTITATEDGGAGAATAQDMTIWVRANDSFSDDFEDGNLNGWTIVNDTTQFSNWQVTGSAGRQQLRQLLTQGTTNATGGLDSIYHLGSYAYRPDVNLTDFELEAEIQLRSDFGEECGLMWRYQDGDNYYRLSFNQRNSFGLLERKVAGVWSTLARNSRGLVKDQEYVVTVTTQGPVIHVAIDGELVFAAHDEALTSGSIGAYARADCGFDFINVTPVDPAITVAISDPTDFSVDAGTNIAVAATVLNRPTLVDVDFELDSVPCPAATESAAGLFESTCSAPQSGLYTLDADVTDNLVLVDSDSHANVGAGGDHYAAIGNSISDGSPLDTYATDGTTTPGWVVSSQGYNANLTDSLNAADASGRPYIVADFAVPADRTVNMVNRLPGVLEQSPDSNGVLIIAGTNDARDNVSATIFEANLRSLINQSIAAGKVVWLAKLLPIMGPDAGPPFVDPATCDGAFPCQNAFVQAYNTAIDSVLADATLSGSVFEGPDLWDYYLGGGENRVTMYGDTLHPNGLGTALLGALWHNALTGDTDLPFVLEDMEVRLSEGGAAESPILYQQNLIEVGDQYYVDSNVTLTTSIPAVLANGVWIMTEDADVNLANTDYLSFDVGPDPVDVYLAYDSGAALPASLSAEYSPAGLSLSTDNANAPTMTVYLRSGVSGTVVIDGADGGTTGADANYIVIVVE